MCAPAKLDKSGSTFSFFSLGTGRAGFSDPSTTRPAGLMQPRFDSLGAFSAVGRGPNLHFSREKRLFGAAGGESVVGPDSKAQLTSRLGSCRLTAAWMFFGSSPSRCSESPRRNFAAKPLGSNLS